MSKEKTILVVDDDRMSQMLLQHNLMELGYVAEGASGGDEAMKLLSADPERFDVVVLDRMMPGMDGLAVTRELVRTEALKHIPVVMVTGADNPEEVREGIDAGVFYYLTKPVKKDLVQSVVGAAMRQSSLRASLAVERDGSSAFSLMRGAKFSFCTIGEAEMIAGFVANAFPDPGRAVSGIAALMFNAVEHGICEIGFEAKGQFIREGTLQEEIAARSQARNGKSAEAVIALKPEGVFFSVKDPGPGFNWREFTSLDMSRNAASHGRSIVRAKSECFDKLIYKDNGSLAIGFVSLEGTLQW